MDGRDKKSLSDEATASQETKRMKLEEKGNWTTVTMIQSDGSQVPSSKLERDATTSYATNRETVYHKNARTVEETHLIKSAGSSNQGFSEEHWSSEIKSFVTAQPPKFIQVIKAFRVLATDTLTLVVEVESDPPAIFEWFCNDRSVQQDKRRFKVRHGLNITTLTVEGPEQGVYKCTARNPAGISTTYGYITVNAQPQYQKWTQQKHAVVIEESYETTSSEQIGVTIKQAPKFVNGVPNLTLKPGAEAIIDVEVDAYPPAKFTWYVNGYEFRDSSGRIAIYYPKENRCVARFPIPQTGEYKVVAENSLGKDQSIGYIDIKKEISVHQTERPPLPVESVRHTGTLPLQRHQNLFDGTDFMRSSSVSKNYEMYEESSYYQRSTSLPRPVHSIERHVQMTSDAGKHHEEEVKGQLPYSSMTEIYRAVDREDGRTETLYRTVSSESTHTMPQPPKFTSALPKAVSLSPSDELVLSVDVKAAPQADIKWKFDGSDVKESKNVTILSEHNRSTLIAKPPVQQGRYSVEVTNEAGTISSATTVHRVEEETFEQVDEHTIISERGSAVRSRSSPPPEIVENAITVTSAQDGWELVDRADLMKSSSGSVETVKHVETSTKYSVSDDRKAAPPVPPKPAPVQISSFTYTQKVSEESGDLSMKQSAIIPQPKTTTTQTTEMFATEMIEERRQMQPSRKVSEPLPKRPQVLRQPPPEVHVKAGEKLVLESKVDSYPESSFKWYQNNFEVRPSASVQIEAPAPNESRAIFKKPTDGIYKVTASNVYGSCTSSTRVTTEVVEEMLEESSVSIIRTPAQQVQPQQHIQKFQFVRKGRVEPRKDLPKVPKIHKKFASLIRIPQHKPLVLSVEADAIPEATFTWRVNNFEVRPSALVHIERPAPNVCRATFTKPSEGRYEVIASNERGTDVCSTKVAIDYDTEVVSEKRTTIQQVIQPTPEPPVFVRSLPPRTQLSDTEIKEFQLNVLVDSQQPVTFRWFADGSLLSNSVEHQMINEAFESTLLVRQPIRRVRDYSVEVSNASGTIRSTTSIYPPITTRTSSTIEELLATEASTEVRQRAPRFTTPLYATELEEGERLTAEVVVDHDGAPCEFLWYLNGKDVRTQPGFRVDSTHYVSTLVVESVNARTDGKLSVIATNRYGTAESSATITVNKREDTFEVITVSPTPAERPPKIVSPLHSTVFTAGQPMTLRCHIDALPPAQIIWTKDEVDLAEWVINEDITTNILPDGTYELTKPECTPDDAGLYECSARNAYGTAQTAAYVTVEEMVYTKDVHEAEIHEIAITKSPSPYVPQEPPRFTETMTSEIEDEKTVLKCKVHSEAPVEISWYHNNVPLTQNEKYTMRSFVDGTQTLSVRDVSKRDEGVYMCRAESRYGVAETSSQVITKEERQIREEEVLIEEHTDEQIQLPQRTDFQKKVYTDTSVKLISETEITDSEENYSRTAELKKNEEEYKLLVKVAETVAKRLVANIVIEEAVREAAYRIREQIHTSDEEEIFIERTTEERTYAPRFETNIECQTVRVGDTVRFATDVRGHPTPRIHWYFGQQRIQQSDHTEVLCLNGRSTLVIRRVTKEDEGVYFCEAENRVGKAVLSCDLRVIDTSTERFQSTLDFSRTAEYVSTETETEVHSNILVNHSEEAFEHRISFLQPRTISLGYDCRASTSKVYDDSVIIRREERRQRLEPAHKEVTLNVNVEKPTPQFKHDVQILQQRETDISMLTNEQWFVSSEEVMQTRDITLTEKQKRAYGQDSTVNISTTIVIEKPSQRALHEVICIYDERVRLPEERFHAVRSVELRQMEEVNELFTSVLARKDEHQAHEVANVEVRRPPSQFDHTTTVMESEVAHLCAHYTAPTTSRSEIVVVEVNLVKYSPVLSDRVTRIQRPIRRATAEQRIVILEGVTESFSEEVFWSLKKIQKAVTHTGEAITNANIEVRKPFEQGEHITTIIDKVKIIPEILAIAAAATKIQITNVYITLTKKGEVAHQALVIEYESYIEDEASLNIALLTVPAFHSKQEEIWTRETRIKETYDERNIVAVFVEVDANCPNQSVELVASVNIPVISNANLSGIQRWSTSSVVERSDSITESSSYGVFEAPRFLKQLENVTTAIGNALQFKCIVSGMPMPEIRWFVDGDEIHTSRVYETVYEDGVCILRINEVVLEDEGEYMCEATNPSGRAITKCFLHTTRDMAKEETLVPAGASAVIHCETITQEKSLIWQKDRRPLSHDDRYEYSDSADGHEHSFTIHGVRKSDEGEYGVIISEAYTAVTNITVIDSDYQLMRGEEATTTHYFSVPMKRPTFVSEATMNSVEQRHFYDEYQVCDVNEYFDLHFRTQSYETPVVVRESRSESVALSCSSRESSTGRMEEEIVEVEVKRHEWQKAAKDVTVLESHVLQTTCEMSLDSTDYDVSIELAPFYGRVTMVEKVVTPTPRAFASIQIAQRCIDADLFRTNVYGMLSVESIRWMPRYESGVQMSVSSTRSETVELGAIIGCGTENEQISVVLLTSPPISHVSSVACSYAQTHLWTELCAEFVSVVNTEISRLISNDTAVVARLDSTTVEDIESVLRLHRDESKELLNAVVTTLPEPIFVHFSDNVAYTELSQWLNSTVIRGDYSEITRKLIRTCSEHIYLQESSLEEQFSSVDCHQEYAQEMAECILKPHLVPKTAEVSASFANEQVVFSLDSAVVRQTGSNFVAKMINTAKEWICLQETTIEDNYSDIFIECATSYQDCFISLMSRPSPETVQVVSEIALQKAQYFFDWSVDECVERRFIARVMRNAFISMQLRGITIEEGTFDVLIGRRWEREQLQVTVLVPARAAFENAKAGFAFEGVNYLMESFEVRSIESDFVVKVSNTLCLSVSMCASTTEEIVTHIEKEQNNSAEHALVTVIPRPPPHHAEVITDIASQEFNNFFDSSLVQRIEQRTSVIIFRQAYTSMQLHRTLLEEGDFGVWMGRILEQDEAFVTVICRPPPINARVSASIETQETSYFFDSFVDQQVEFKVISKVRRKAFTSMQLHAETLEEGEFDVLMGRRWDREEVNITLISHPPPVHASVQLTLEVQEASYFFDSFTDQRVELNVRSKLVTRAFTSMQLHAVKLEEGIFDVFLIRTSNPVGTSILLWHRPLPISAHVMSHIELQEASYLFDSFVDETVECKVLSRVFTRAFTTMRLHATSIEDGQFSVFMVRKTEEEEIFVSVAAPTTSSRTETRAGFACFQMSYLFDSEVARGIRRYLRTKGTHRAKASLSLCAAKSQRDEIRSFKEHSDFTHERMLTKSLVDFIADQDRSCNFSGERHLQSEFERLGATVTEGYDSSTVMLERTYQESTHVRISAEPSAQGISAAAYEYAHTQLRASAFKEAEFHTSLNRRSESDELSVTVVSPLYSHAHHEMALSMVSKAIQEDEMQRTAIEEECGKIVGEIASDEGSKI